MQIDATRPPESDGGRLVREGRRPTLRRARGQAAPVHSASVPVFFARADQTTERTRVACGERKDTEQGGRGWWMSPLDCVLFPACCARLLLSGIRHSASEQRRVFFSSSASVPSRTPERRRPRLDGSTARPRRAVGVGGGRPAAGRGWVGGGRLLTGTNQSRGRAGTHDTHAARPAAVRCDDCRQPVRSSLSDSWCWRRRRSLGRTGRRIRQKGRSAPQGQHRKEGRKDQRQGQGRTPPPSPAARGRASR